MMVLKICRSPAARLAAEEVEQNRRGKEVLEDMMGGCPYFLRERDHYYHFQTQKYLSSKWQTFFRHTIISNIYSGNLVRRVVVRSRNSTKKIGSKKLPPGGQDGGGAGRGKDGKGGASTRSTWVRTKKVITIIYYILYISYKKGGKGEASTRLTWVRSSYYKRRILSLQLDPILQQNNVFHVYLLLGTCKIDSSHLR